MRQMSYCYLPSANGENKIREVTHPFERSVGHQPHAVPGSGHLGYEIA